MLVSLQSFAFGLPASAEEAAPRTIVGGLDITRPVVPLLSTGASALLHGLFGMQCVRFYKEFEARCFDGFGVGVVHVSQDVSTALLSLASLIIRPCLWRIHQCSLLQSRPVNTAQLDVPWCDPVGLLGSCFVAGSLGVAVAVSLKDGASANERMTAVRFAELPRHVLGSAMSCGNHRNQLIECAVLSTKLLGQLFTCAMHFRTRAHWLRVISAVPHYVDKFLDVRFPVVWPSFGSTPSLHCHICASWDCVIDFPHVALLRPSL